MDKIVNDFFAEHMYVEHNKDILKAPQEFLDLEFDSNVKNFFQWIRHDSRGKSLKYDITANVEEIKEELTSKVLLAVPHRECVGWRSITLFGYSSIMTNSYEYYTQQGIITNEKLEWTDVCKFFPKTVEWIKRHNPLASYSRIRIMILEPGGSSAPHKDYNAGQALCGPINIAIVNPPGAQFAIENGGLVPWEEGDFRSMDVGSLHCVRNIGNTHRIHIIITPSKEDWDIDAMRMACKSFLKYQEERNDTRRT